MHAAAQPSPHGSLCPDGSLFLCSSLRIASPPCFLVGEAVSGGDRFMELAAQPRGTPRAIQDPRLRCVNCFGLALDGRVESQAFPISQREPSGRPTLGLRLQRVRQDLQVSGSGGAGHRRPVSIPNPTLRPIDRSGSGLPLPSRCSKAGSMEGAEVTHEVREISPLGSHHAGGANSAPRPLPPVRAKPWGNHAWVPKGARLRRRQIQQGYVMDLFAGAGGVSKACEALGYFSKQWDIQNGPQHDLRKRDVLKKVLSEIRKGRVLAIT